ncbi:MAG: AAA family ATPase, partial [Aquiluna sp.]
RADFLVASGPATRGGQSAPEGAVSASSVVEGPAPVITLLSDIWIVEDINEARKLLEAAEAGSKIMITKDGDYVSQTLIAGGGKRAPSKLELAAQRAETRAKIGGLEGEIQAAASSYSDQRQNLNDATEDVQKKLAALQSHDAELAAKAESLGRLMGQLEGAKQEKIRLEAELEEKDAELANRESAIEALEQSLAEVPVGEFTIDSEKRSGLVAGLERSRQAETDFRVELGALVERRAGLTREADAIRTRLERAEKLRNERLAAEAASRDKVARAQVVMAAIERLLPTIDSLLSATRIDLRELQDARTQKTNRLAELRASVTELDERHLTLGQGVQDSEMRSYELRLQLSTLGERIFADLGLSSDELIQDVGQPDQENLIENLERALRKAESRLSQLGSINPLALEEFAALEERHKYLSEQFADLSDAKKDLLSIISDLNEKMQSTFAAGFEDTKKSFERVFRILFPGGQGSLTLVGDEGLELGVEVSVKPAGKRIERMSLLSGGERSLAALALLVAIFKARPSPFYVLDEVEAALDDTNLGRLLAVLEELRDSSQLVIVTHQKRTMEIADALYGISMGKDGVTQVVGERLERVG